MKHGIKQREMIFSLPPHPFVGRRWREGDGVDPCVCVCVCVDLPDIAVPDIEDEKGHGQQHPKGGQETHG